MSSRTQTTKVLLGWKYARHQWDGLCLLLGPDLQNVLRQSYDYLTIMPKLRSTYDGRLIYKTSYEERKDFLK